MYNFLGYFPTSTIRKLILAIPKSLYSDVYGISMNMILMRSLTAQNTSLKYTPTYNRLGSSSYALVIPEDKYQGFLMVRTADSIDILPLPKLLVKNIKRKVSDIFSIN